MEYWKDRETEILNNEIWKDIFGYEGIYQVSSLGRIKSLDRLIPCESNRYNKPIKRKTKGMILKQRIDRYGYLTVALVNVGIYKYTTSHRLVAFAFLEMNEYGTISINHKDCNKLNNLPENLEWSTPKLQYEHARSNNLINENTIARGENSGTSKLKDIDIIEIYENKESLSLTELSKKYNISTHNIRFIWDDKSWVHITKNLIKNCVITTLQRPEVEFLYTNPLNFNTQEMSILFDVGSNEIRRIYNKERHKKFTEGLIKNQIIDNGIYLYKSIDMQNNRIVYFNNVNNFVSKNSQFRRQKIMKTIREGGIYNNFKFEFCSKEEYANYLKNLYDDYYKQKTIKGDTNV